MKFGKTIEWLYDQNAPALDCELYQTWAKDSKKMLYDFSRHLTALGAVRYVDQTYHDIYDSGKDPRNRKTSEEEIKWPFDDDIALHFLEQMVSLDYWPPMSEPILIQVHCFVLVFFYNLLKWFHYKNVDVKKLDRINCSYAKISWAIGLSIGLGSETGKKSDFDKIRINRSKKIIRTRRKVKIQKTIELFHTIEKRSSLKPYCLAARIRQKWGPENQSPSRDTIIRYLRAEKLIE